MENSVINAKIEILEDNLKQLNSKFNQLTDDLYYRLKNFEINTKNKFKAIFNPPKFNDLINVDSKGLN